MSTQVQADVSSALFDLKFESRGADMPGAPHKFEATDETVEFIKSLLDEKRLVTVDGSGTLSFE